MKKLMISLLSVVFLLTAVCFAANAATETLVIGVSQPKGGGFQGDMVQVFADELEALTDGKVTVKAHYGGALSSNERELAEMAQAGTADIAVGATTYILGWAPSAKVFDLPFTFDDVWHFKRATQGELGEYLSRQMEDDGIVCLGYLLPGFRSIFNNKRPINKVEDMQGLKIRCMESPVYVDMFKLLGMVPTPLPSSELFSALQTGVVDAGENDPASVVSWGWIDVIKYYSLNRHTLSCNVMLMNKPRFDSFPTEIQEAIKNAALKSMNYQLDYIVKAWDDSLEKIEAKGVEVNELPPEEIDKLREIVAPIVDQYRDEIGPEVLEMVENAKQ
jgi:TRAP-type transport system periplasmic protein